MLFGKLRPYLRKSVLADEDGICSTDILVFRARQICSPEFLCYLTHSDEFDLGTRKPRHPASSIRTSSGLLCASSGSMFRRRLSSARYKNATKDEAIALGVDQVRRYHAETPELFVPQMVFTATEAIGFSYGVTWNLIRRNIFNWKHEQKGNLEAKVKSFCDRAARAALAQGLHPVRGEGRGAAEVHPPPAPDDGRGAGGGPLPLAPPKPKRARAGVAHAGERQDLHDDQGRRAAVQGGRARTSRPC